jgi:3-phosphoshikimate 1-carboxyvinyltransferase
MAPVSSPVTVTVPGDKSLSHRALMFAALGTGDSEIRGLLASADVKSTAQVLRTLGVSIPHEWHPQQSIRIAGVGRRGLRAPSAALECGNSGTTTRLMAGVVAGHKMAATFVGDASLSRRPMRRIARPLTQMGATFQFDGDDGLPMTVQGTNLRPIDWVSPTASAQVKSAILLAALTAGVSARVQEPARSRDHTERMLASLGAPIRMDDDSVTLDPVETLSPIHFNVPGDPSSALFMLACAILHQREAVVLNVGVNATRIGAFRVLERMGAQLTLQNRRDTGGEPVADVHVAACHGLRGVTVGGDEIPSLIDEIPMLACLAAVAEGESRFTDAAELRVKESDRISAVVSNLRAIGVDADELPDGLVVAGGAIRRSGAVVTHADHRIAMSFGVLASLPDSDVRIDDPACVDVSYPDFWSALTNMSRS